MFEKTKRWLDAGWLVFRAASNRVRLAYVAAMTALLLAPHTALAADADLDTMITNGLGKLVKYARYGAIAVAAGVFLVAWAQKSADKDNHATAHKASTAMWVSGIGFVVLVLYKPVLTSLVSWTGMDPAAIPAWVWQS